MTQEIKDSFEIYQERIADGTFLPVEVEDFIHWDTNVELTLWDMYTMATPGAPNPQSEVGTKQGLLQRKLQLFEWEKDEHSRAKKYLRSLIKGSAKVDMFLYVPLYLLIISLKVKVRDAVNASQKEMYQEVLEEVEADQEFGTNYYIIDGQNRLFIGIVKWFNSDIAFPEEKLTVVVGGERISLSGKTKEDIEKNHDNGKSIIEYIKHITCPCAFATSGDIDDFIETLICKNESVVFVDWQKLQLAYALGSVYSKQINNVLGNAGDEGNDTLFADNIFSKFEGRAYAFDIGGYDQIVSEMLIWMDSGRWLGQKDLKEHDKYFNGQSTIDDSIVESLKKYLREYAKVSDIARSHGLLRNYIMLRWVLDNPKKFKTFDVPSWKIHQKGEFTSKYFLIDTELRKDPNAWIPYTKPDGSKGKQVTPQYFPWANGLMEKERVECRIRLLLKAFVKVEKDLLKNNVIVPKDSASMPSLESVYIANDGKDYKGRPVAAIRTQKSRKKPQRGHKKPAADGGSNTDLVLQGAKSNNHYKDTAL